MSNWQTAWGRDKHAVGRAAHEAWAAEKVRQGFADHAYPDDGYVLTNGYGGKPVRMSTGCTADGCTIAAGGHHPDMMDYDDLAPNVQAYDIETGIVGYRMGYEVAEARIADLERESVAANLDAAQYARERDAARASLAASERRAALVRAALTGMLESYEMCVGGAIDFSPGTRHALRGVFIGEAERARSALAGSAVAGSGDVPYLPPASSSPITVEITEIRRGKPMPYDLDARAALAGNTVAAESGGEG